MKKIMILLSLLIIGLFLVGCNQEAVAGQSVKVAGQTIKLDCKQFGNFDNLGHPNKFCKDQKYDTCVSGEIITRIPNGNLNMLFTLPIQCEGYDFLSNQIDINDSDSITKFFVKENTGYDGNLGDTDNIVTCCRVR